jgi:hypothetical protein
MTSTNKEPPHDAICPAFYYFLSVRPIILFITMFCRTLKVGYVNVRNVVVEWLTVLRIREVVGSDLGMETGYPHRGFRGFPLSFQANAG